MYTARSVKISTIAHATEDTNKIYHAISQICPKQTFQYFSNETKVKGHHGNEIRTIRLKVSSSLAQKYLEFLWRKFSSLDREQILFSLRDFIDEKNTLHLRLGKQEAFLGKIRISPEDPIKIEIGFPRQPTSVDTLDTLKSVLARIDVP